MRQLMLFGLLSLIMCVPALLGQDVRYNFDRKADFSRFKTYKWITLKDAAPVDELINKQIIDTIDTELGAKGLKKITDDNADLYIGYQAGVDKEKEFTSYSTGWGYGPGWYGGWYGPGGMTTGSTSMIYVGQLALDMYDSANHDLVWRGSVSKTINTKAKPDKQQRNLEKAVAKLLRNYPPSAN